MRSIAEIAFRTRQETANLFLLAVQPRFSGFLPGRLALPDPRATTDALRGSDYAKSVEAIAETLMVHRIPIVGITIDTGREIQWRRDYVHEKESGTAYFRRIPYLDGGRVGDHKMIWELNRHQHLVLLAQAFLLTGRKEFKHEIFAELESWLDQNPFQRGINWASALEVGIRALSWIWLYHFVGAEMPEALRRRFLTGLYRHEWHLAENLSVYFSPNTHLLGEAVALHALATLFPAFPHSAQWRKRGAETVTAQLGFQVQTDGSHFEQSTYYHVYALDFFLFFYLLAGRPAEFRPALERMADYLFWLLGPARRITFFGDDDGGRLFHPYGERDQFARATLTTCGIVLGNDVWIGTADDVSQQAAWWMGVDSLSAARQRASIPRGPRLFESCGSAFLESSDLFLQMDCGPFGWSGAGHSHSDTLSVVLCRAGEQVLIDPGTYTYVGDPEERHWFRGSAAHNTVRIDGLDQGRIAGPFRWSSKPDVKLETWRPDADGGYIRALSEYEGFSHRRQILLQPGRLLVLDEINLDQTNNPGSEHVCEQIWQLGPAAANMNFNFSVPVSRSISKFSPAYGAKCPGTSLTAKVSGPLPIRIAMLLDAQGNSSITVEEAHRMIENSALQHSTHL